MFSTRFFLLITFVLLGAKTSIAQTPPETVWVKGVVSTISETKTSFLVVDADSTAVVVKIDGSTNLMLGKTAAAFDDVVVKGEEAFAKVTASGVATDVYNKNRTGRWQISRIKEVLDASDEECAALAPRIHRVVSLQLLDDVKRRTPKNTAPTPIEIAVQTLRNILMDKTAPDPSIRNALQSIRDQRARVQADLKIARHELSALLTVRQEAVLVQMGLLE